MDIYNLQKRKTQMKKTVPLKCHAFSPKVAFILNPTLIYYSNWLIYIYVFLKKFLITATYMLHKVNYQF